MGRLFHPWTYSGTGWEQRRWMRSAPVGGGSTDDLTETTTVFECFAANEDNGDGTMSGCKYHATMNWSTSEFTYGLGKP